MPTNSKSNPFAAETKLASQAGEFTIFRLNRLSELGLGDIDKLPYSIKVLLESCLRNTDNFEVHENDVRRLAANGTLPLWSRRSCRSSRRA
jgi:aconitate hydratase